MDIYKLFEKYYPILISYAWNIIAALLIFLAGKYAARLVSRLTKRLLLRTTLDPTLCSFTANLVHVALLVFVVIAALNKLGIETASLIALVGAAGLAVGLALQGSLSNFAAGVMIIILRPFKVGDFIEVCSTLGTVKEIRTFHTVLVSSDKIYHVIPNSKITGDVVRNWSSFPTTRIELSFSIAYGDDIARAREVLQQVVAADRRIVTDPPPIIGVRRLGDSGVELTCRIFQTLDDYWGVMFDTLEAGKNALQASGFTIPFPQRDVRLVDSASGAALASVAKA